MAELSIVIVNFNTKSYTAQCIESIYENPPQNSTEIIVVDNASADGDGTWLANRFPDVRVIFSRRNLGIAGGNNMGIRAGNQPYVLLVNNDTLVLPRSIDKAAETLKAHPEAAGVGGQLLNPDGSFQSGFMRFPSIRQLFLILTKLGYVGRPHFPSLPVSNEVMEVDWMSTAFMLFRREALEQVGLVDEEFFIYADETDLQLRLKKAGWNILFDPDIRTIHFGGKSLTPWVRREMVYRGYLLFFTRHHDAIRTGLLRIMYLTSSIAKMALWTVALALGLNRDRAKRELQSNLGILAMSIRPGVTAVHSGPTRS